MLHRSLLTKLIKAPKVQPVIDMPTQPKLLKLNCRKLALNIRRDLLSSYNNIHSENPSMGAPSLTIISVGNNTASEKFIDRKLKVLNRYNIESTLVTLPERLSLPQLLEEIRKWNSNPS
jgi:methylenetetrahydrofolate dehydrogenase (NADP+)/methenyltetrahydrofolate cyclohydrolase/formyltetrahydrofolate synthetase